MTSLSNSKPLIGESAKPLNHSGSAVISAALLALGVLGIASDVRAQSTPTPVAEPKPARTEQAPQAPGTTETAPAPSIAPVKRSGWGRPPLDDSTKPNATPEDLALESVVRTAARDRWKRVAAAEWELAYSYLTPSARATTTLDAFRRGLEGAPVKFMDIGEVVCRNSVCSVKVYHEYSMKVPKIGTAPAPYVQLERWRAIDGKPYLMAESG